MDDGIKSSILTDILNDISITQQDYHWTLSISPDSDYELHLKRPIDSCFINNYFIAGLKGFAANIDLQPVFNHYKCITYVCSYFTKDETECSQAIINAAKEAKEANLRIRDGLRKIGAAFLSTREVSAQECVYRCMPELWLRKIFPKTVFVSTDLPENRVRFTKTQQKLDELDDDSTDIFKSNIIVRYSDRPKNILAINEICLALFAAHYFKDYNRDFDEISDSQPEVLCDDLIESQNMENNDTGLPDQIKLLNDKEIMKCRKLKLLFDITLQTKEKSLKNIFTTFSCCTFRGVMSKTSLDTTARIDLSFMNEMFKKQYNATKNYSNQMVMQLMKRWNVYETLMVCQLALLIH